jgi:hypothetical protein
MEVSGQLHTATALPPYPLVRMLGGPVSGSAHGSEEENSQPLPGTEPQSSIRRRVSILTELPLHLADELNEHTIKA